MIGPLVIAQGPLGVCNPNEKQEPPSLFLSQTKPKWKYKRKGKELHVIDTGAMATEAHADAMLIYTIQCM